eukprot:g1617.t1
MNLRRESLSLYRRALRLCNRLPFENVRRKSKYNAREIFEIYRNDKPCEERIRRGHEALNALELLSDKELAIATIGHDRWKT